MAIGDKSLEAVERRAVLFSDKIPISNGGGAQPHCIYRKGLKCGVDRWLCQNCGEACNGSRGA